MPAAIMATASRSTSRMAEAARGAKREANADFAGAAGHHERHHSVETDQREQQRQRAEAAGERGQEALGTERAVDLVVQSTEPEDRQPRVDLADDAADGRNRLLGRAADLDVEGRAGVFAFEQREEGLLGIVAKVTVVEIGDRRRRLRCRA